MLEKLESTGNLVVLKLEFGRRYAMVGSHPDIASDRVKFSEEVQSIRKSGIKVGMQYSNRRTVKEFSYISSKDFMEAEGMGVEPPRRCEDCRGCPKCSFRGQKHTELRKRHLST